MPPGMGTHYKGFPGINVKRGTHQTKEKKEIGVYFSLH